ncbi:hypothetical protein C6B37_00655 [Candidatus Phytoplasma phoenicium]|uniref:Uncharacterized protein n=1 Tax=Candidatus Phytoplasma phoenicium TaxID=198422 RepID=A0A2S8NV40_9MOLU|nr:hypothetical protein C6B37_00655 [Candidatus Phytoplasma phoenicium]
MKKLTKIQLINWHLFSCQTIEIQDNTLISGENGAGKSTLLDALQYVLISGKSGVKFNIAANDNAKRTLENYIKGKIGAENKEFLRNKDVITHICLEFYDEKTQKKSLLGCLLELPYKGLLKEKFYFCAHQSLNSDLFISDNKPFNAQQFRNYMKQFNPNFEFCETKKQYQNTLTQYLKINMSKYIKILPKALAFKPLNLQNFVFEFLLEENPINITSLKNSIQQLRKVEKQIELEKQKLKNLKIIIEQTQEIKLLEQNIKINFLVEKMVINLQYKDQLQNIKKQQMTFHQQISYLLTQKKENNLAIENINNQILQLQSYKHQDHIGSFLLSLQKDLDFHQKIFNEAENQINLFQSQLKAEKDLLIGLSINYPSLKFEKHLNYLKQWIQQTQEEEIVEKTYTEFKKNISNINDDLSNEIIKANIKQSELIREIHSLQQKINELNNHLETLQSIKPTYHPSLLKLKNLLTTHLSYLYKKEISIYPFCELIDIKEELWRNAIEGFLGMRKFNLIVDERYFQPSLKIYEQFQASEKIYDIGLVNIGQIPDIEDNPQSLASKIFTENTDAIKYTRLLLSHIICELDISNLQKHKIAITPQGMVYSSYTAKQLNPKTYQIPYIGLKSKTIRQQIIITELKQLNKELKEKQNEWHYNENFIILIQKSKFSTILEKEPWVFYQKLQKNKETIKKIQNKIQELKINPHLTQLEDNLEKAQKEKEQHKEQLENILLKIAETQSQYNLNEEKKKSLQSELVNLKESLYKEEQIESRFITTSRIQLNNYLDKYDKNYTKILQNIKDKINVFQKQKNIQTNDLISLMKTYIQKYNLLDITADLDNLNYFIKEYDLINLKNLINYEKESKELRIKTENIFKEEFINKLKESIDNAQQQIKNLNYILKNRPFGNDSYQIIAKATKNPEYHKYYSLFIKDNDISNIKLFTDNVNSYKEILLDELFQKIISFEEEYELISYEFLDYRNYLSYDIQINDQEGNMSFFSKIFREKSGGETQVPFYIIIAICFEQLLTSDSEEKGCLVLLDEAFNNMDENRINAMMSFFNELKIQFFIAIPPQRIANIFPYVKTNLIIMKDKNYAIVKNFTKVI